MVLGYILELSRQSPRVLILYILSVTISVNYLGMTTVLNAIASTASDSKRQIATICLVISVFICILGVVNQFFLGQEIKKRFEEDVRARFLGSVMEKLAGMGLMALESAHVQDTISRVKDNFPVIQRVLDTPFTLIPGAIGLVVYLFTLANMAPRQFGFVMAYAGLAAFLGLRLIKQINSQERQVSPFRREVGNLSAQIMVPTNLAEINRIGNIDWFCNRILHSDQKVMLLERGIRRTRFFHSLFGWFIGLTLVSLTVLSSGTVIVNHYELPTLAQPGAIGGVSLLLLTFFAVIGIDGFSSNLAIFITGHSMVHDFLGVIKAHSVQEPSDAIGGETEEVGPLVLKDVQFSYEVGLPVFSDVSFTVPPGKSLAIVGSNGSGKSTLVKVIGQLYDETGGTVSYGKPNPKIVFMPQDPPLLPSLTVRENIHLGDLSIGEDILQDVAGRCLGKDMLDHICSNEYGGFNPSGGQRQLIAWARLLCRIQCASPDYVILDEPTSALDGLRERALMEEILKMGSTVVYITHKGSVARMADYILFLKPDGTYLFGENSVLKDAQEFRELFG